MLVGPEAPAPAHGAESRLIPRLKGQLYVQTDNLIRGVKLRHETTAPVKINIVFACARILKSSKVVDPNQLSALVTLKPSKTTFDT